MNKTLLTVSGNIPDNLEAEVAAGKRPLPDYLAMARAFPADLLDYNRARTQAGWFGRLLEKLTGPNLMLAWVCFRLNGRYRTIFTDGEQIGIFLALFSKFLGLGRPRARHLMIVHILSVGKKMKFFDWFRIQSHIDIFFCYSTWQKQFIEQRWNISPPRVNFSLDLGNSRRSAQVHWRVTPDRVVFTPFMVDSDFFAPDQVDWADPVLGELAELAQGKPIICSVGLEFRDYPTLMTAVRDLPVHVVIAAGSPWSKRSDSTAAQEIPPNVTVRRFTQYELRQVYAASAFVVMPLYNVEFQAGVTAILEGMALGKAILCSRTPGQTDVIVEGKTGLYAPPENPAALRDGILYLLEHEEEREEMGRNGRSLILSAMNLHHYVNRLSAYL